MAAPIPSRRDTRARGALPDDGRGPAPAAAKRALTDVVGIYWHFMDVLWVFLFLLLFFWR